MVRSLHESAEKFDYFIMAVLSGLIAYLAKEMPAGNLSSVSFDLYLLSLLLLLIAMFLGLVRIEQFLQIKIGNVAREQDTELQQQMNELNRMWKSEVAAKQIEDMLAKLEKSVPAAIERIQRSSRLSDKSYRWRNRFLLAGFVCLIAAEVAARLLIL